MVSKNCLEIDPNMLVENKEPMRIARYNIPLALVKDRFIFAIGGMIGKGRPTEMCEVYDSLTNNWYNVG